MDTQEKIKRLEDLDTKIADARNWLSETRSAIKANVAELAKLEEERAALGDEIRDDLGLPGRKRTKREG